jgi:hypothetical protein
MHNADNQSNTPLFDDLFCEVSYDGTLKQKDNSFFKGKNLSNNITENFEEHLAPYKEAFAKLETELREKTFDSFDDVLSTAGASEAIGDFDSLLKELKSAFDAKASVKAESDVEVDVDVEVEDKVKVEVEVVAETVVEKTTESVIDESVSFYQKLVDEAQEVASSNNWAAGQSLLDAIIAKWTDGPQAEPALINELKAKVEEAAETFANRKAESQKKYEEKREKNFAIREDLLAKFQKVIDQKKWQAQGEVNALQRKFENLRPLPASGTEDQDKKLQELIALFDEQRKDYLVEIKQKEDDNLIGKLATIEKMEQLVTAAGSDSDNWSAINNELETLNKQWKKIGRVPKEKEDEIWERFRQAQDSFLKKRMEQDADFKKETERNIAKREKLISKAEALVKDVDLASAVREINKYHTEWKKLENLPKELNDVLWERFKAASDAFSEFKSANIDTLRNLEQENLTKKEEILESAKALVDEGNFKAGIKKMEQLLALWKEVGPVPQKKAGQLWKKFREILDDYYKNRRAHFKEIRGEQQTNLKRKNEIVDRIKELSESEDLEAAVKEVQDLQAEYKKIGFVPIKMKDKIWEAFNEACDLFYGKLRGQGGGRKSGYRENVSAEKQLSSDLFRMRKEADKIREQIMKYSDTMTYFKPNKKGLELRSEIQMNIDNAEKKYEELNKKIEELQAQLNEMS